VRESSETHCGGISSNSVTPKAIGVPTLSREAEDWIFCLRDGRSVRLPPEIVGSHKVRSKLPLPPFRVGEAIEQHENNLTLVMEEDGSMRPSAERQAYGQGSESGGKEVVAFEEIHFDTWEDRSLGDDGLYFESKGDDFAENQVQFGVDLFGWGSEKAPLEVEPLAMIVVPHSPRCDDRWLDITKVGINKNQLGSYRILRLLRKCGGHLMRDLKTEWRSYFWKLRLDAIKGLMLIRERKKVLVQDKD
jgi:hypothetical protein